MCAHALLFLAIYAVVNTERFTSESGSIQSCCFPKMLRASPIKRELHTDSGSDSFGIGIDNPYFKIIPKNLRGKKCIPRFSPTRFKYRQPYNLNRLKISRRILKE